MGESKHTPGPWWREHNIKGAPNSVCVDDEDGGARTIASVPSGYKDNARENAALIAAAPDMYEALRAARAGFEILTEDPEDGDFCRACGGYIPTRGEPTARKQGHKRGCIIVSSKSAIDAALAKAEGR